MRQWIREVLLDNDASALMRVEWSREEERASCAGERGADLLLRRRRILGADERHRQLVVMLQGVHALLAVGLQSRHLAHSPRPKEAESR